MDVGELWGEGGIKVKEMARKRGSLALFSAH